MYCVYHNTLPDPLAIIAGCRAEEKRENEAQGTEGCGKARKGVPYDRATTPDETNDVTWLAAVHGVEFEIGGTQCVGCPGRD